MNTRSSKPRIIVNAERLLGIHHVGSSRIKTGVKVEVPTPCFLRGTSVLTTDGATRVEDLVVGDLVVTAKGTPLPVTWIGRRRLQKEAGCDWDKTALPVCISRFALDERTPQADLYLSPNHALFIDGILIPAIHLVNGRSIVQTMPAGVKDIEYFHIRLATHEVIFAEGAAVETLLFVNDRETFVGFIRDHFDNVAEYTRLYGMDDGPSMTPCAPRVCYNGRRSELKALLRRIASPVIDIRDPIQIIHDRIAVRTEVRQSADLC